MHNVSLSLLWPHNKETYSSKIKTLNTATLDSLNLAGLCKILSKNDNQYRIIEEILAYICCSEEVIKYRQDIFDEMLCMEKLIPSMEAILKHLENLKSITIQSSTTEDAKLWRLFSRFKELEGYVDCVTAIMQSLQDFEFKSEGMKLLKEMARNTCDDEDFKALADTVKQLNVEINEIQSITLGINLDTSLNPIEATLISVNNTKFKDNSWLKFILPTKNGLQPEDLGYVSRIKRLSDDKRDTIMYNLYKDIEKMLKPVVRDLSSSLNKYTRISGHHLINLIPEITFYLCFARLFKSLNENGMPLCKPVIAAMEDRKCIVNDIYNINLAIHMLMQNEKPTENIVFNNTQFDDSGRIFILTGPNRGGKTVYTEGVGLLHILFQAGVFVPGTYACISPVDSIFTHFPVDENQTVELGRLGEETKRFNEIVQEATKYSLILLNESLASTSFTEGLYIAQDIVKALRYLGARVIFNTHMHELATYADAINSEIPGDSKVISLVTGLVAGKRSFLIQPGAPLGKSYAMDIAIKYGVSFSQIVDTINKKAVKTIPT